jgi:hypothetical protein
MDDLAFPDRAQRCHQLLACTDAGEAPFHHFFELRYTFLSFVNELLNVTRRPDGAGKLAHDEVASLPEFDAFEAR